MTALCRVGDQNTTGGQILRGASTVFCEGIPVGLHPSPLTPHAPWDPKPAHRPHARAQTTNGAVTVFAEFSPVLIVGSGNTCGHAIIKGSTTVFAS